MSARKVVVEARRASLKHKCAKIIQKPLLLSFLCFLLYYYHAFWVPQPRSPPITLLSKRVPTTLETWAEYIAKIYETSIPTTSHVHNSVGGEIHSLQLQRLPNVTYWCGYRFADLFIAATFPESQREPYSGSKSYSASDVLVFAGDDISSCARDFPGNVIYLNGEPHEREVPSGALHLGPETLHTGHTLQVFYVSFAALELREDLTRRPTGIIMKNFLIYASSRCIQHRQEAFKMLATIDEVTAAGSCHGALPPEKVRVLKRAGSWQDNTRLFQDYKFALVMENTCMPGYVTEKILTAFLAGSVPIYFGTEDVFKIFNRRSFVFFNVSNPGPAMERIRQLHSSPRDYELILSEPMLVAGAKEKYFNFHGELREKIAFFLANNRLSERRIIR
jgi:hypothetical protein